MNFWQSLYLPSAEQAAVAERLRAALHDLGYTAYDPFGLMPGRAYAHSVRLFIAPPIDRWLRVIVGAYDDRVLPMLARGTTCLSLRLNDDDSATITTVVDGAITPPEDALTPLLPAERTADDLRRALTGDLPDTGAAATIGGVSIDALPADVRALVANVDPASAEALFGKMGSGMAKRFGAAGDAGALLRSINWNGTGGRRLSAIAACLGLPANWRTPDFVTLRDAYQLHERKRRRPNASVLPGDADAMSAVPDALTYTPIFAGKDA